MSFLLTQFLNNASTEVTSPLSLKLLMCFISKHLFRFAIQLIITSTNRYYNVVCITVYGEISLFFFKFVHKSL